MDILLPLALFLPLISFLILLVTSFHIGRKLCGFIACASIFLSFLIFFSLFLSYVDQGMAPYSVTLFQWIPTEMIKANFTLLLDPLSLLMTLVVTGVGFLIHVYSNGYIEHDEDYARYFALLNFFIFSMLLLVLAGHLLLLFVGWEGVGLASYLLIGFWYDRKAAAQAATKAFVVNRIGDFGFLVGLLLTFQTFGTGDMKEIFEKLGQGFSVGAPVLAVIALLYFMGATGKSAQIPLHIWLPDAMEGPTPVSALIHAATMVTAGVYLVVRMHELFLLTPFTLYLVGVIGGVTSLFAALCAIGQNDLKKVLAYSTISQLGFMFLACGSGAFYAAMFHLTSHAFIKALLFLSAGNVVHMGHELRDMEKMGGLSKIFTKTHWLFLIGVFALAGVPPLAAFFSKDLILEQEHLKGLDVLFYVGLASSILTAFYMTRAYCLTFTGETHLRKEELMGIKEAPKVMLIPTFILAFLSIVGGAFGFCFECQTPFLEHFLGEVGVGLGEKETLNISSFLTKETLESVIGAIVGIGAASLMYYSFKDRLGRPIKLLRKSFYIDEIYWFFIALPIQGIAWIIARIIEPKFFDGMIHLTTKTVGFFSKGLQQFQSGEIRSYVAWLAIGAVFLVIYFVI